MCICGKKCSSFAFASCVPSPYCVGWVSFGRNMEVDMPIRVLVCGGRDFKDQDKLFRVLDKIDNEEPYITAIINGMAKGADKMSSYWAQACSDSIAIEEYPAQWRVYGKSAGYKRNTQMLVEGKPDLVVAFPGGKGTAMMIKIARDAGVEVLEVTDELNFAKYWR